MKSHLLTVEDALKFVSIGIVYFVLITISVLGNSIITFRSLF